MSTSEIENILIVKTSSLGDVIQCFPALDCLRHLFPNSAIDWVVEKPFAPILQAHPHIRHVREIDTKKWRRAPFRAAHLKEARLFWRALRQIDYDLSIDFQGNCKSGLLMGMARSRKKIGFGKSSVSEWPNLLFTNKKIDVETGNPISEQYVELASETFPGKKVKASSQVHLTISEKESNWIEQQIRGRFRVMVCTGSNWENKRLALDTWKHFLQRVEKKWSPMFYFVWKTAGERREVKMLESCFPSRFVRLPRMSLPVWQRMISKMHLLFSVDSSALHLAATTQTPTYSFFGPSSPAIYKPFGKQHRFYQGKCPYEKAFIKRCPKLRTCASGACLKNARAEQLFDHFSHVFSSEWTKRK